VLDGLLDRVHASTIGIADAESKRIACYRRSLLKYSMLKGKELGDAIRAAMKLKRVTQKQVAEEFKIKQPSVSEWLRFGRVDKGHISHLIAYFSDVAPMTHWGLGEVEGESGVAAPTHRAQTAQEPAGAYRVGPSREDLELLRDWHDLDPLAEEELRRQVRAAAEKSRYLKEFYLSNPGPEPMKMPPPPRAAPPESASGAEPAPPRGKAIVTKKRSAR